LALVLELLDDVNRAIHARNDDDSNAMILMTTTVVVVGMGEKFERDATRGQVAQISSRFEHNRVVVEVAATTVCFSSLRIVANESNIRTCRCESIARA